MHGRARSTALTAVAVTDDAVVVVVVERAELLVRAARPRVPCFSALLALLEAPPQRLAGAASQFTGGVGEAKMPRVRVRCSPSRTRGRPAAEQHTGGCRACRCAVLPQRGKKAALRGAERSQPAELQGKHLLELKVLENAGRSAGVDSG